ncbi:MurR/RpiR family transcriptional regulator [uncultured Thiothrix sp.]|uniref:MurR/RpiR family transcriptional regulator n=1 Tax=uncultured Thiothrix sp. TaxID=223185 RepID=UPI002634C41E|nr:MurR/RpiR family transcriptional regulator [uncultured Thiothrix sp.]
MQTKKKTSQATKVQAPNDYEAFIKLIHDQYDLLSKSYKGIAVYLTQNPNDVAVLSVNEIAKRCNIHASSFVRFAQSFGYEGFKDLQTLFQKRLSTAAPGFETRINALEKELSEHTDHTDMGFLRDLVVRDIASLQELLENMDSNALTQAVELLQQANIIYLAGQLRSSPVVELLRYILTMLGKRCILLDPSGGLATHMARNMQTSDVLVAVSFRFYAKEVVNIVEEASTHQVPIIAITDSTLSPVAKSAKVLFSVPEHEYAFSRSLAAPMCLAQALTVALANRLQVGETDQPAKIRTVTR